MKKYLGIICLLIFLFSCRKYEAYPPRIDHDLPHWEHTHFNVKGTWLLTSAKRISRHTTDEWGDSINYFWYPPISFPLKYNRGNIYDTIKVGSTTWTITKDKIHQGKGEFHYERKNENTAYCDQLRLDFYDTYMVLDIDSHTMVLETNKQSENITGYFLFDHFTILEFKRIDNAPIQNTHYSSPHLNYCVESNKYDTTLIWNNKYEVLPYHP
tara:strand:- start:253 stop:888 length:636 start_codon:yes stop_codon:yes gene_type:complete